MYVKWPVIRLLKQRNKIPFNGDLEFATISIIGEIEINGDANGMLLYEAN